ncbi:unnamed protein product [Peronospora farinosa]|uniref:Uncharacterized protein n=1 Tax=Peronospora farinosa TaxID=134698 RepID=A0AAV0UAI1_9STRA|nr:unnamed protein product [Peronospora farinosa]
MDRRIVDADSYALCDWRRLYWFHPRPDPRAAPALRCCFGCFRWSSASCVSTSPPVTAPCDAQSTRAPPGRGTGQPSGLSALDTRGSSCYEKGETTCWKCLCFGGQEATASSVRSGRCHVLVEDFAECVAGSAVEEHSESCPIGREELHRYFTGTSTAPATFDYTSTSGQVFRAALYTFQPSASALDAFAGDLLIDEVKVLLSRATNTSSLDRTASATSLPPLRCAAGPTSLRRALVLLFA